MRIQYIDLLIILLNYWDKSVKYFVEDRTPCSKRKRMTDRKIFNNSYEINLKGNHIEIVKANLNC